MTAIETINSVGVINSTDKIYYCEIEVDGIVKKAYADDPADLPVVGETVVIKRNRLTGSRYILHENKPWWTI